MRLSSVLFAVKGGDQEFFSGGKYPSLTVLKMEKLMRVERKVKTQGGV
jgi:hypothetical protein